MQHANSAARTLRAATALSAAAIALLLASGAADAQIGPTGIPMGATELPDAGLSRAPFGVAPGLSPIAPATPNATMGMTGFSGSTVAPAMGMSPGISPPGGFSSAPPSFGITNFGTDGLQALPGSPRTGTAGTDH